MQPTPIEVLRQKLALLRSIYDDTRVDTSLNEIVDYLDSLEKRVAALEKGPQNLPFILPKKDRPDVHDPDCL
jgi:hypothetical protein